LITTLFFGDAHAEPGQDLTRFQKLGNFITARQPHNIIDLGDFVSLSAISHWDASKKLTMEGRRYEEDVQIGRAAYNEVFRPLENLRKKQRRTKSRIYNPTIIKMDGNHEGWLDKYLEQNPAMAGYVNLNRDLGLAERPVDIYPYKARILLNDINIMHAPLAGNDMPVSGLHIPYKALQRFNTHIVMGHYHRSETASIRRTDAKHSSRAIICPAFFDGQPHYLSPNAPVISNSGILLIHQNEETLWPQIEEISMEQLFLDY
jgi:hypothetical protein